MSEWSEVALESLGAFSSGKGVKPGGDGPFVAFGSNGPIGFAPESLHDGGVIIGRVGAYCGSVTISHEPFWASDNTIVIEPAKADLDFLYYLLQNANLNRYAGGSAQPLVTQSILKSLKFSIPEAGGRSRIASILRSIDDLIENNRRRVELLEEMARAVYREWFVHFRYPGHENIPLVDSELGPIPEGWKVRTASEALHINPRRPVKRDSAHSFITMGDLSEHGMSCFPSELKSGSSGSKFENGDTLFARITPCLQNGKTGLVQCLEPGEVGRGSTEFVVMRGHLVGNAFTYALARSGEFRGHAIASMSGASGRQRVRNECFDSFHLACPPAPLSELFEAVADPLLREGQLLSTRSRALTELRDLLLPRLVSGRIDVSDLDLDLVEEGAA